VKLGLLGAAFVTSVVTYHLYENPLRRSRSIWGRSSARPLVLWPASLLAVVMVGIFALSSLRDVAVAADARSAAASSAATAASVAAVAESVALAQKNAPLPASLNPSLDKLYIPDYSYLLGLGAGCIITDPTKSTQNRICPVGDKRASRTLVVAGDSHAQMWLPAFNAIAQQEGWKLIPLISFGCDAIYWGAGNRGGNCATWFNWAAGEINGLHPGVVVLGSWDIGAENAWAAGLRFGVQALKPSGARIVLMEDAPGLAENPIDCLGAPGATLKTCTFGLPQVVIAHNALEEGIAASTGATYVEVLPWFCWSGLCPTVVGSTVAYADQTHMTAVYSLQLAGPLSAAVRLG
jgi:hypothetical protein